MEYNVPDSSGTDDDLPPFHQNRVPRGSRVGGHERSAVGSISYSRIHTDMEAQIHHLEQEAYCAVLRAFKAQSDALTWEKEGLITELRKELRVSDDEHRELLTRVNADDIIAKIREWRKSEENQAARLNTSQPVYDHIPSPTVLASRKKQKTSQTQYAGLSSMKSMPYTPTGSVGSRQFMTRSSSGVRALNEPAEGSLEESLIGRKVWTRWPDDNNFYEAVVTDYNAPEDRHALVYDINTAHETWEWVDLKEIAPEDIQWEGENPGISHGGGHGGLGQGFKKSSNRGGLFPGPGRGRGGGRGQMKKDFPPQNGIGKKVSDDIEILNTHALVKEVENVFNANHPDPVELEKARKMLKEHEKALIDAIAQLSYVSDGESDGEQTLLIHGQAMDRE